jgi:adenine deaminase
MDEINGFAAAGLSSDHEVKLPEETFQKLEHGIFLEMRVNAIPTVVPYLVQKGIKDWSNTSVTTDDRNAADTLRLGAMNYNIKLAIDGGVPVEAAYAMGSYYTARHWHLEHLVGSIAPGRYADVVLLNDPKTVSIDSVIADGKLAAEHGKYLLPIPKIDWPKWATQTIDIGRDLTAADFQIQAPAGKSEVDAAILTLFYFEPDFMTAKLPVKDGLVQADPAQSIEKVALVDRYHHNAGVSKMFWKNVGPKEPDSALACSIAHDLHNVWVVGSSDPAMALAVNELAKMQGGWVLVRKGNVVAKVRLEVGGLMSARPAAPVAAEYEHLWAEGDKMEWYGAPGIPKRMIAGFLTCTPWKWVLVAPTKEIPQGLVNVTTGETHPVVW